MSDAAGAGVVAASLAGLVLVVSVPPASRLGGESRRKIVHVGMGLVGASFGWLFDSPLSVTGVAAAAAVLFWVVRWRPARRFVPRSRRLSRRMLGGLRRSGSQSHGEIYFAAGVAAAYWIAWFGDAPPQVHAAAVLMLALPDAAAAAVGRRVGGVRLATGKTLAGSAAFFATADHRAARRRRRLCQCRRLRCCSPPPSAATLAELLGRRGGDNLLVPAAAAAVVLDRGSVRLTRRPRRRR